MFLAKMTLFVIGHACKSINLPITATVFIPDRDATKTEHKKQIFEHLKFIKFEDALEFIHIHQINIQCITLVQYHARQENLYT